MRLPTGIGAQPPIRHHQLQGMGNKVMSRRTSYSAVRGIISRGFKATYRRKRFPTAILAVINAGMSSYHQSGPCSTTTNVHPEHKDFFPLIRMNFVTFAALS